MPTLQRVTGVPCTHATKGELPSLSLSQASTRDKRKRRQNTANSATNTLTFAVASAPFSSSKPTSCRQTRVTHGQTT
jgi:hypothetical protein